MNCREAEELLPAYALNALGAEESALVEEHLDTCPWCPTLLREHAEVAAALAQAAEPFQPPPGLKDGAMKAAGEHIQQAQRGGRRIFTPGRLALGTAASMAALALVAAIAIGVYMSYKIDDLKQDNAGLTAQLSQLAQEEGKLMDMVQEQRSVSYIMASPGKQVFPLQGGDESPKAQGNDRRTG